MHTITKSVKTWTQLVIEFVCYQMPEHDFRLKQTIQLDFEGFGWLGFINSRFSSLVFAVLKKPLKKQFTPKMFSHFPIHYHTFLTMEHFDMSCSKTVCSSHKFYLILVSFLGPNFFRLTELWTLTKDTFFCVWDHTLHIQTVFTF